MGGKQYRSASSEGDHTDAPDEYPDSGNSESKQARQTGTKKDKKCCRCFGIGIQIILFLANAIVWIVAIMAIIGGFIVGLNTKTINIRMELLDLLVTTPATIFIIYGLIIVSASVLGCFTATGGNKWITMGFIIAGVLVLVFDYLFGIQVFFSTRSLLDYMRSLRGSMDDYLNKDGAKVGIFRLAPMVHWNHLQMKGQCCGMDGFEDWRSTPMGKEMKSIPDTCCNEKYLYRSCGNYFFRHPDNEHHTAEDIIYTRGCIKIFPDPLVDSFEHTVYVGIILGALIIFCILLAIVLLLLVLCKTYTPGGGPEGWRYARKQARSDRGNRRVVPAGGDQKRLSLDENGNERRVSFQGPSQFIPANRRANQDEGKRFPEEGRRPNSE